MIISIRPEELELAIKTTKEFDKLKTYNKFVCKNNYIGVLGEIVFDRFLSEHGVEHKWIDFIKDKQVFQKNIFKYPDFIIDGVSYDIKTTHSRSMWFQKPIHDVYIYIFIDFFNTKLNIVSYASKELLLAAIGSDAVREVVRGNRKDYVIEPKDMIPIEFLIGDEQK